ncbi:hypothetical protein JCM15519_17460 [Fundidesulfovibrio butyratiphilus]
MKRTFLSWTFCLALAALAVLVQVRPAPAADPPLPETLTPDKLAAQINESPAELEIVDIRPPEQFADYALPGAENMTAAEALADPALQAGRSRLVLVDRDGDKAWALGAMLMQKTKRPVSVLSGGMTAWWRARELGAVVREVPLPAASTKAPAAAPAASGQTAPAKPAPNQGPGAVQPAPSPTPSAPGGAPQPPASKNAGC